MQTINEFSACGMSDAAAFLGETGNETCFFEWTRHVKNCSFYLLLEHIFEKKRPFACGMFFGSALRQES
jgi:hypothetical protein